MGDGGDGHSRGGCARKILSFLPLLWEGSRTTWTPTSTSDGARRLSCSVSLFGCLGQSFDRLRSSSALSLRVLNSSVAVPTQAPSSPSNPLANTHNVSTIGQDSSAASTASSCEAV